MDRLTLTAVNKYGEEIKCGCGLSITHQQIHFKLHSITYKQSRKGYYFILEGLRYYFKVYDNYYNKWLIDCACF